MLGPGSIYSPSASFQTLLANISAAQRPLVAPPTLSTQSSSEYLQTTSGISLSPPLSPSALQVPSSQPSTTPPEDRRSSSIAALRLKAREHELKLEMLRQNGQGDLIS